MADIQSRPGRRRRGAWGLRKLARNLVAAAGGRDGLPTHWSERARSLTAARTTVALIRQRPRAAVLAAWLSPSLRIPGGKLQLWASLGRAWGRQQLPPSRRLSGVLTGLSATQAWNDARERLQIDPLRAMPRLHDGEELMRILRRQRPQRLFLWHHHDPLGELPNSWLAVLAELQRRQWQVLVTSSGLGMEALSQLKRHGLLACRRTNIGLCLGAYKDLCLLLADLELQPRALVLSNDSTLPVRLDGLIGALDDFASRSEQATAPQLGGFTDSVERGHYHLQSYWLEANGALLASGIWRQFWQRLPITGSKDSLIDHGEIGLSQTLLRAGVELRARYPLLPGLLHEPAMAQELQAAGIHGIQGMNQSLHTWRSLLTRGFPLVKKRVLFDDVATSTGPPGLSQLIGALPSTLNGDELCRLESDLQTLLRSRHTRAAGS